MDVRQLFVQADRALEEVFAGVGDDQWSMPLPEEFQTSSDAAQRPTLREVVNYHAYDEAWVPAVLAGASADDGDGPAVGQDLLGDAPANSYAALAVTARAAVEGLDDLERTVHLSYGDHPAGEYLQHVAVFRGLRAHDVAAAVGTSTDLPPELVQGLWDLLEAEAEGWRAMGVFGPAVPVAADAPLQDRVLGLSGRAPVRGQRAATSGQPAAIFDQPAAGRG